MARNRHWDIRSRIIARCSVIVALALIVLPLDSAVARGADLGPGGTFHDDNGNVHEGAIEAIAEAGITKGCNPPDNDRYCPDQAVTRGQMASFLVRALNLAPSSTEGFTDIAGSLHEADILTLAAAGITKGCNPPDNDRYCPDRPVSRGEMATFLARGLDLPLLTPPPAPFHLIASFTTHHPCCQTRVAAVQELADLIDGIVVLPRDTLSMLRVIDYSVTSGYCQTSTTLFNAVFYAGLEDVEHRPHVVHFDRYPPAIESTLVAPDRADLKFRNDTEHPIQIRTSHTSTSVTVELWGDNDDRTVIGDYTAASGTILDVVEEGGTDARIVTAEVTNGGKTYWVTRTITVGAESTAESWTWTYR